MHQRAATTPPRPGYDLDAQFCRRPRNYPQGSKLQVNPQDKGHEGEGHTPFGYMPYWRWFIKEHFFLYELSNPKTSDL